MSEKLSQPSGMKRRSLLKAAALMPLAWHGISRAQGNEELVFYGFGGDFEKAIKKTVIPPFEKKFKARVVYVTGTSNQIIAKVRAQRKRQEGDILWTNVTTQYQGVKEGLFAPLDHSIVTNLDDVHPAARYPDDLGVIIGFHSQGIEYSTKEFSKQGWDAPTSWMDLWDERFKKHVVSYNMPIGYANLFLAQIAILSGGSTSNLEPGWKKIEELIPNTLAFVNPPAQVSALFASGAAWIGYNSNGRIYGLADSGAPVSMATPKEGLISYPQPFALIKDAPHARLAQEFINFTLDPDIQAELAVSLLTGPANKKTKLTDDVAARVPYGADAVAALLQPDMAPINDNLEALTLRWQEQIAKRS